MKKFTILITILTIMFSGTALALTGTQSHAPSQIIPGTFAIGDYDYQSNLFLTGNLGVGTSTANTKVNVSGTITATSFVGDGSALTGITPILWTNSSGNVTFTTGNVGIGTTTPLSLLHVSGISPAGAIIAEQTTASTNIVQNALMARAVSSNNMADGFGAQILFNIEDDSAIASNIGSIGFKRSGGQDNSSEFNIGVYNNGISNQAFTIKSTGNVGIGTTTPDSKLAVSGLPSGTTRTIAGATGNLVGAVCITDQGNMYIDTDGSCVGN